jgi:heat shock protein HslJ
MFTTGLVSGILAIVATIAGPGTPTPETTIPPVVWELVSIAESGKPAVEIADPSRYTLQFLADGNLAARVDCNRGRAGYTAAGGVLSLTGLATTRMLCALDSQDAPFMRVLQDVTAYQLDPRGYLVLSGETGELQLRPAPTAAF